MLTDKAMAAVERQVAASLGGTAANVRAVVDSGTPHAGLLAQADVTNAGLIVLGPGRTADRVVRHATVPTLIARHSRYGIVIGATDFSDPSLPALELAAAEARRRGSQLQLFHVVDVGTFALASAAGAAGAGLPFVHGIPGISIRATDDLQTAAQGRLQDALIRFGIDGAAIASRWLVHVQPDALCARRELPRTLTGARDGLSDKVDHVAARRFSSALRGDDRRR